MGIYWANTLYYGFIIGPKAYAQLTNSAQYCSNRDKYDKFITAIAKDHWIIAEKSNIFYFGNIDRLLDAGDKMRGWVKMSELKIILEKKLSEEEHFQLMHIDEAAQHVCREILAIASSEDEKHQDLKSGWWICEATWSTLDGIEGMKDCYMERKLPVKFD